MATLSIPFRHTEGLSKLFSLKDEYVEQLIKALNEQPLTLDPEVPIKNSLALITGFGSEDVDAMAQALVSLLMLRGSNDSSSIEELSNDFVTAIQEGDGEELKAANGDYEKIKNRLVSLFSIENMLVSSKAVSLKFESENLFTRARIVTQIIPVFVGEDDPPKAAIISHQLGIHYFHAGHKEFYLVIDEEEIDDLIKVLERAKKKAYSLKSFLDSTDVKYIENV